MNMNRVSILGVLETDPVEKRLPVQGSVVSFRVKTETSYKRTTNGTGTATEYHSVCSFDPHIVFNATKHRKGDLVLVEGRLATRSWEKDGVKQFRTEVVAERLDTMPKAKAKEE